MKVIPISFRWLGGIAPDGLQMLKNITEAGRICYQSEKIGGEADFVRSLIQRGHESVIEHEKISVVVMCDRGVTHEEVRHRIASYSQESTRYCNYTGERFGGELTFIDIRGGIERDMKMQDLTPEQIEAVVIEWVCACADAERHYNKMVELGASAQIARSVLNNSLKAGIAITMNLREWRHFFKLRTAPAAHPQMREVAEMLLEAFKDVVPVVFDDL